MFKSKISAETVCREAKCECHACSAQRKLALNLKEELIIRRFLLIVLTERTLKFSTTTHESEMNMRANICVALGERFQQRAGACRLKQLPRC